MCRRLHDLYVSVYICIHELPFGSAGEESTCNAGDLGLIPGLEKSPGEGNGYPLWYSPGEFCGLHSPWGH